MKLQSIRKELLLPMSEILIPPSNNHFILLLSEGDIDVRSRGTNITMNRDVSFIAKLNSRLTIHNRDLRPITVKSLLFKTTLNNVIIQKPFALLDITSKKNRIFIDKIHSIFSNESFPNEVGQAEESLINLMEVYFPYHKSKSSCSGHIDSRLIKINRYIRANYNKTIILQDLSDLVQCNPTYLCNTYSKIFGVSPIYYLNQKRIQRAMHLLTVSSLSITDIATSLGYESVSQFSSMFKRYTSLSPSSYRKKNIH